LYRWAFNPPRRGSTPEAAAVCVRWAERHSIPLDALGDPKVLRAVLNALSCKQDGTPAVAATFRRKRAVLNNALEYAVELRRLPANPLTTINLEIAGRRVLGGRSSVEVQTRGRTTRHWRPRSTSVLAANRTRMCRGPPPASRNDRTVPPVAGSANRPVMACPAHRRFGISSWGTGRTRSGRVVGCTSTRVLQP
jgi:hypothetical protein